MSNISFLMDLHGRQWVKGLKPLSNVGDRNIRQLEKFLAQIEGREPDPQIPVLANIRFRLRKKITEQPTGNQSPERKNTTSQYIERDAGVVVWVLQQANDICELCDSQAPFMRSDGTPYLEVHHVDPLGENGPDIIENAVALCPNCHRAVHYSQGRRELTERIRLKVARII